MRRAAFASALAWPCRRRCGACSTLRFGTTALLLLLLQAMRDRRCNAALVGVRLPRHLCIRLLHAKLAELEFSQMCEQNALL